MIDFSLRSAPRRSETMARIPRRTCPGPTGGTGQAADPAAGDGGDPDLLHLRRDQGGRGETAKDRALALRLVIVQMWPKLIIKLIRLLFGGLIRSIFSDLEDVFFWVYQMDLFLGIWSETRRILAVCFIMRSGSEKYRTLAAIYKGSRYFMIYGPWLWSNES